MILYPGDNIQVVECRESKIKYKVVELMWEYVICRRGVCKELYIYWKYIVVLKYIAF